MTKQEFMDYLDDRLSVLNINEREDIKQEYSQHIDMKMRDGMTEAQALESFGDITAMVDEILAAYNIDPEYQKKEESTAGTAAKPITENETVKKLSGALKSGISAASSLVREYTPMDLLKAMLKIFVFCLMTFIVFVFGFKIFRLIGRVLEGMLPSDFMLDDIVSGAVMLFYIAFFVIAVGSFVWRYVNDKIHKAEIAAKENVTREDEREMDTANTLSAQQGERTIREKDSAVEILEIILFIVKFCILWALIPCFIVLLVLIVTQGILAAALVAGYPVVGLSIGCLGTNMCLIAFLSAALKFIFSGKEAVKR